MPQENQVLRCFSCETFQVHLVKKAKNWECKLCGAKQSFKRHYGKGSGKDCRNHVMKLNELRVTNGYSESISEDELANDIPPNIEPIAVEEKRGSKWAQYLDDDNDNDEQFNKAKKRKMSEEFDEVIKACKKSDRLAHIVSNDTQSSKYSKYEGDGIEKKKSKNIFDSDLDNTDFLNFI